MEISASVKILHGHFFRSYSCIDFFQLYCFFTLYNQRKKSKSVVLCPGFSPLVVRPIWRKSNFAGCIKSGLKTIGSSIQSFSRPVLIGHKQTHLLDSFSFQSPTNFPLTSLGWNKARLPTPCLGVAWEEQEVTVREG